MRPFWNFIVNAATDGQPETVELRIDGDIVSDSDAWIYEWFGEPAASPNAFREELKQHDGKDITLWIDSYGGDVFAAAGMYNALKSHIGKVIAKIDGKAMSAASVLAMAADEIQMSPVAVMMIHNPWSVAQGDMRDMRKAADVLDTVKETIVNAYVAKTRKSKAKISAMMDDETWMSANVAVKQGFADSVLYENQEQLQVANFSFNRFAVQNNAQEAIQKLIDFERRKAPAPPSNNANQHEEEKRRLLEEIDLI
jgi:ATP-dependent Clp protease, protease subunit